MKKILFILLTVVQITFSQSPFSFDKKNNLNEISSINIQKNIFSSFSDYQEKKKSPALAIIYSLLLPGMGELYAGNFESGKYFTFADVSLWTIYIGMNYYKNLQTDNFKAYAASMGNVKVEGKDEDYFANISEYLNIEEYNNDKALNRSFSEIYDVNKFYWKWSSQDERKQYRNLWVSSQQANNNLRFVAGALVLNRLISIINAIRLTASYNKKIKEEIGWNLYFKQDNNLISDFSFNFITRF